MLGFQELSFGPASYHVWYSQASLDAHSDPQGDLAGLGGTPWEELPWEDGMEAPVRPALRPSPQTWTGEPQPLPSPELMAAWSDAGTITPEARKQERARDRDDERRRIARIKAQATKLRREREAAQAAEQRRQRDLEAWRPRQLPPARRKGSFVTPEQLGAFLGLPSEP